MLSYIGWAAAMCWPVDIPLIIIALAQILVKHNTNTLSVLITFGCDFLLFLDATTEEDDLAMAVKLYYHQWWSEHTPPTPMQYLSISTIDACLKHHRNFYTMSDIPWPALLKTGYTWPHHMQSIPPDTLDCS